MSFQLYKTRLKCLLRNKESMFWCYIFPILLATCFFFAFNNLFSIEDFDTIPIAYVSEGNNSDGLKEALNSANVSDNKKMFNVTYCDKDRAKQLLDSGDIEAYIVDSGNPVLYIKENSMKETLTKAFLDNYKHMEGTVKTILKENPNALNDGLLNDVMNYDEFVEAVKNEKKTDDLFTYYFALLAYTCIFAANWGLDEVVNIQADLSERGARVSVSPINKMKLFLCNLAAAFTDHMGSLILLFIYMYYVIKVDFGNNLLYLMLICLLGSLCGLALGGTVGIWVKKKAEIKEAILTMIILGGGFLSGMMVGGMQYLIAEKCPLLGYINPVNLVSNAMYSLYYYDTYEHFYLDAAVLFVLTVLMGIASYVGIRRKNYASI
jgi:ABC-2 type transport system permease protein